MAEPPRAVTLPVGTKAVVVAADPRAFSYPGVSLDGLLATLDEEDLLIAVGDRIDERWREELSRHQGPLVLVAREGHEAVPMLDVVVDRHRGRSIRVVPQPDSALREERLRALSRTGRAFANAELLDPTSSLADYVVSRTAYRRVRWLILSVLVPLAVVLAIRIPLTLPILDALRHAPASVRHKILTTTILLDVVLAIGASLFAGGSMMQALGGPLASLLDLADANQEARLALGTAASEGHEALIGAGSGARELIELPGGVYANPGCFRATLSRYDLALPLPPVYRLTLSTSWLVIEQGASYRIELVVAERPLGQGLLDRVLTYRTRARSSPHVVASYPFGPTYSPLGTRVRNPALAFRRLSGIAAFAGGLIELASSLFPPLHRHLRLLVELFPTLSPVIVREYANALSAAAGVAMIGVALGLHRGRRRSYQISLATIAVAFLANLARGGDLLALVVLAATAAILIANRGSFDQPSALQPSLARSLQFAAAAAVLWLVATAVTVAGHLLFARSRPLSIGSALEAVWRISLGLQSVGPPPFDHPALRDALQLSMVVVAAGVIWALVGPLQHRIHLDHPAPRELEEARRVLAQHPQGTLDYFALRRDKLHWQRHGVMIAYGDFGSTVIVSPDPIGPAGAARIAFVEFLGEMKRHGKVVAVLGAGSEWRGVYEGLRMHSFYLGDEALVKIGELDLAGKRHKSLRQAVNRMHKYGYSVELRNPLELSEGDRADIAAIMAISRRGARERGFSMTLGRIFDPVDTDLLISLCREPSERICGFCQWVPAPAVHGYSLDLMRRDKEGHPNGMFDLLIVETIRELEKRGYSALSLNFAAMRAVLAGERGDGLPVRMERWVLGRLSGSMQIESLWRFNSKFDPVWLPRYLVVDAIENLPTVAVAAAKAESLWDFPLIGRLLFDRSSESEATEPTPR